MRISLLGVALACLLLGASAAAESRTESGARAIDAWLDEHIDDLVSDYERIHANPELSLEEKETAAYVAAALERAGFRVQTRIGGYGVAGVLSNGDGPTLLIRGDMDALPVTEETGLPYASKFRGRTADGEPVGVMHACGHDLHTVNVVATARVLAAARERWSGTLVVVAEPAEEIGRGALSMMKDGLFDRVPKPDYTIALHVDSHLPAGQVGLVEGWAFANVDSVDVILHGVGGHGARPHLTVDPIVASAHFITALQTLVSRRIDPLAPAVVTVGSIHSGSKHNVIPESSHMQLTVRSYSDEVRTQLLHGITQLAEDTCRQFLCPRTPVVKVREEYTPAVYNDPALTERAGRVFADVLGAEAVVQRDPAMVGEDFGRFARTLGVPGLLYRLGSVDPDRYAASLVAGGRPLPTLHSGLYAPLPRPTLRAGVQTMSSIALEILAPLN
jgi:amidohydrolase